jgi:pimeloyl-ACP methyl ester carboxylesterase
MPHNLSLYRSPEGYQEVMACYEAALHRLTVPYGERTVPTRLGETHVLVTGPEAGQPLVLFHGWNTNAGGWWPQINDLALSRRVYAPDTIGQAGKSAPVRPSVRGPAYGQWAADVIGALGLQRARVAGGSGGAWLILKLADVAPERIRSAVLLGPAGIAPIRLAFALRALAIGWLRPGEATPFELARLVNPSPLKRDEDHIRADAPYSLYFKNQLPPPTLPDRALRRLAAPTLLLVGRHEVIFNPQAVVARASRLIPNLVAAELVEGTGHDLTYNRPDWINQRILRFLDEAEAAEATPES